MTSRQIVAIISPALLSVLAACSGGSSQSASPSPNSQPPPTTFINTFIDAPYYQGSPEGFGPRYHEPQPTAEYAVSVTAPDVTTRPAATIASRPHTGTRWQGNGVQFRPYETERQPGETHCNVASVVVTQMLYFAYLPPDTTIEGPPYQMLCEDGTLVFGGQDFRTYLGAILVSYETDAPILRGLDVQSAVDEITINGRSGLIYRQESSETYYTEGINIAFPMYDGYFAIQSYSVPAQEILKIIAGISCAGC